MLHLADLYVVEAARRQGAGRALLAAVAEKCIDSGGKWLAWTVLETNLIARNFYDSIGAKRAAGFTLWIEPKSIASRK